MSSKDALDALVVGAGPTGLTLACELMRHGARCRLVDKLTEPVGYSKAAAVQARTLELLDALGCADALLGAAKPMLGIRMYSGGELIGHVPIGGMESAYPHIYGASQRDTERVLAERLAALGGKVERGVELASFTQDDGLVTAKVVSADGAAETIEARYLVGCDGAHSTVRKTLGLTFEGHAYEEHLIQADLHVDFPTRGDGDEILTFLTPDGPLAMFPMFRDGRYRVIVVLMAGAPDVEPTLEVFQQFMEERGPRGAKVSDPAWMVPFRIHCRRTNRYRDHRVFVAGDAAHIHSPAGGQGMNTGMQDAENLGWKLALVAKGRGDAALLDSYEAERLPVAKALLAGTDAATRGLANVGALKNPLALRMRNQVLGLATSLHAVHERLGRNVSMLEIGYAGSPIVKEDRPSVWGTHVAGGGETEAPSLVDWAAFGDGPAPGMRAPEVFFAEAGSPSRVFELFRDGRHVLLLFDGAAASAEGYANLASIARRVREVYDDVVTTHIVVPRADKPAELEHDGSIVFDAEGLFHRRYGARSEALYLVRPDRHVAYRCQPADGDKLEAYLRTIFRAAPAKK